MKSGQIVSVAASILVLAAAGCGGKKDGGSTPPEKSAEPAQKKSVDDLVAPAQTGAPAPAPVPPAPAPEAAPAPAAEPEGQKVPPASSANSGFAAGLASRNQFERNMNWVTRIGSGDPAEKQKVFNEVKKANLSPAEMQSLRDMGKYYGVKF